MKNFQILILLIFHGILVSAGDVEKTFFFSNYKIESWGAYQTVNFGNTLLSGMPGEPMLPWHEVALMLPPGESAASIEIIPEDEIVFPGPILLCPQQHVRPISADSSGEFIRNQQVYMQDKPYPTRAAGQLLTQYLNGYAFALSTFTPVKYNPAHKTLTYYRKVTVRIKTHADAQSLAALKNLTPDGSVINRVQSFAMNPEMADQYPRGNAPATDYQYLIISPVIFATEFQPLISLYGGKGISVTVVTTDFIYANATGIDQQEKIRNYIIGQYQQFHIKYVLLAGNPSLIPCRGFYCHVISGPGYTDNNIPADLYYSGLDGTYNAFVNNLYGEVADDPDLLPDIAVGRFTVNDTVELHHMIHKSVSYQTNPVLGELNKPLLAGEWLYGDPLTFGSDYMELLIDNHNDNGYFTHGIPSTSNNIEKLYDITGWSWSSEMLLSSINSGKSFIHHLGHANSAYMLRMGISLITNANFSQVNGIIHNYQLLYTQGCDDGAFDVACIASKAVSIDNFLAAGIFNSRYGWFDEGHTEGPSEHLEREFVSALYDDISPEKHIGATHMISKIKTAPFIDLPGEFEFGAQRWVHYDCNLLGDPAMEIWTAEPAVFSTATWTGSVNSDWNNPGNWSPAMVPTTLYDLTIAGAANLPVITTSNTTFCHNLTILSSGNLTINPGKSMVVYGTVTINGE